MERERSAAKLRNEHIQKTDEGCLGRSELQTAEFPQQESILMSAIRGGDVETLFAAEPDQIRTLSRLAGNSAVAALLRGDPPFVAERALPPGQVGSQVNCIRTSPPALTKGIRSLGEERTTPNRLSGLSAHMGIF